MPRVLVTKWWGVLLLDNGKEAERRPFPATAHDIANRLLRIRRGEILDEERELAQGPVYVTEERLKPLGPLTPAPAWPEAGPDGFPAPLLHEASLLVARDESRLASGERDRFVAQSVKAMDELQRTVNTLVERLREWYGLHFPEALPRIPDQPTFVRLLSEHADRADLAKKLKGLAADDSIGVPFGPEELEAIRGFAQSLGALYSEHDRLQKLIERETREVAPTLSGLVGSLIAARLIAQAGSLEKLAHAPASTLQTLGAENALFLHLKEGNKPPKHGILFQHALVNTAPRFQRGRISRNLAGHATIAARMDFFRPDAGDRSNQLLPGLEKAIAGVRARAKPPAPPRRGGRRK